LSNKLNVTQNGLNKTTNSMQKEFIVKEATFLISVTDVKKCPAEPRPEFAFIGRSNVGKSSLINMLTNRNGLAKTSSTPGKTKTINYFSFNHNWYLVDLPGYGWAKASASERKAWEQMVKNFILKREGISVLFILLDSRHTPQKVDLEFVQWAHRSGVPFAFIFTKADKPKANDLKKNVNAFLNAALEFMPGLPPHIITSSSSRKGRQEILQFMADIASKQS
jgi:GTP-binding protein